MVETRELNKTCVCGAEFQGKEMYLRGVLVGNAAYCPECVAKKVQVYEPYRRVDAAPEELWKDICPPLYQETDLAKLPIKDPAVSDKVLRWPYGPRGLGLSGPSGSGKTRLMFVLLKQQFLSGTPVLAITAKRFESWCHRMFDKDDDARVKIKRAHQVKILFIDDLGKEKYTERVESEFYDLIEDRTANLKPVLWTANATGEQLKTMLGEDRGVPIVRRLREFTEIISV